MITPRQKQVLDYLARYIAANGIPPTMKEIGEQFKLTSPASVHHILTGLERDGHIRRIPNISRGIEIVESADKPKPRTVRRASKDALDRAISEQQVLLARLIELRSEMR
jgi:repressor LexA